VRTSAPQGRLPPYDLEGAPRADPHRPHHRCCGPSPATASGDGEGEGSKVGRRRWQGLGFRPSHRLRGDDARGVFCFCGLSPC
jgi:hypothetical protein